jgi:AAA15 family ATPase/GTPase
MPENRIGARVQDQNSIFPTAEMPDRAPSRGPFESEPLTAPSREPIPANQPATVDPFAFLRLRGGDSSRGFTQNEDEASSDEDQIPAPARRAAPAPRNGVPTSEFQPGAIVRVKVTNFVTYEEAEFFLGPNLNMVIGPNGTGKSSLVCAICLGLGYSSNVLGRASAFGEFVKHGNDEAEIEVELQRKPEHSENYVVGLCIRREDNGRKFTINGQRASLKDIQKLMRSLRIQIDNLCQFLPQDKVAEFAALNPVDLLDKTLQAAAGEEMITWRAELKDHFKVQKDTEHSGEKIAEELRKMEARQQVLQADVEKLRERKQIQEEIDYLKQLRVVVKYHDARKKYKEAKTRKTEAERSLKQLHNSVAPTLKAVNKKQEYQNKIKLVVTDRQLRLQAADAAADAAIAQVDAAQAKCQELVGRKEAERANFSAKKQELGRLRKKITDLEASHRRAPKEFDAADWNRRIVCPSTTLLSLLDLLANRPGTARARTSYPRKGARGRKAGRRDSGVVDKRSREQRSIGKVTDQSAGSGLTTRPVTESAEEDRSRCGDGLGVVEGQPRRL